MTQKHNHLISSLLSSLLLSFLEGNIAGNYQQSCDPQTNVLFLGDQFNPQAFFKCRRSVENPWSGRWEQHYCPNDMHFVFDTQQCRMNELPPNVVKEANDLLHIAILNGSCANGEICLGGTTCDPLRRLCLCPYGKIANLETLSCVEPKPSLLPSSISGSYLPPEKQSLVYGQMPYGGYGPTPTSSPTYAFLTVTPQQANTSPGAFYYLKSMLQELASKSPRHQIRKLIAGLYVNNATIKSHETLAAPGASCMNGERCSGGSICVRDVGFCLCPGEQENQGGRCTAFHSLTATAAPSYQVTTKPPPILLATIWGKTPCSSQQQIPCIFSGCVPCPWAPPPPQSSSAATVETPQLPRQPQITTSPPQEYTILRMPKPRKDSGPGDLCNDGQLCTRGSVCSRQIPICVCPPETTLVGGWCLPIQLIRDQQLQTAENSVLSEEEVLASQFQRAKEELSSTDKPILSSVETEDSYYRVNNGYDSKIERFTSPLPESAVFKRKGSKLPGFVGSRCSLNNDCMNGAYCDGNSNPPNCQCLSTHVNINGRCEKIIYPGQTGCDFDLQCSTGYVGTRCSSANRQCVCPGGEKAIDQTCIPVAVAPGERCNITHMIPTCLENSYCFEGQCVCIPPLTLLQNRCVQMSEPFDPFFSESRKVRFREGTTANDLSPAHLFDVSTRKGAQSLKVAQSSNNAETTNFDAFIGDALKLSDAATMANYMPEQTAQTVFESNTTAQNPAPNNKTSSREVENNENLTVSSTASFCFSNENCPQTFLCLENRCECPPELWLVAGRCVVVDDGVPPPAIRDSSSPYNEFEKSLHDAEEQEVSIRKLLRSPIEEMFSTLSIFKGMGQSLGIFKNDSSLETDNFRMKSLSRFEPPADSNRPKTDLSEDYAVPKPKRDEVTKSVTKLKKLTKTIDDDFMFRRKRSDSDRVRASNVASSPTVSIKRIGEPCRPGDICLSGTSCFDGVCKCPKGFQLQNNTCVKSHPQDGKSVALYQPIGSPCSPSDRCTGGSVCSNSTCTCMNGSLPSKEKCVQKLGGQCSQGQFCSGGSKCQLGVCQCPNGFRRYKLNCVLSVADPGETCQSGERCSNGSVCRFGMCMCPADFQVSEKRCKRLAGAQNQPTPTTPTPTTTNQKEAQKQTHSREVRENSTAKPSATSSDVVDREKNIQPPKIAHGRSYHSQQQSFENNNNNVGGQTDTEQNSMPSAPVDDNRFLSNLIPNSTAISRENFIAGSNQQFSPPTLEFGISENSLQPYSSPLPSPQKGDDSAEELGGTAGPGESCNSGQVCVGGAVCRHRFCVCGPDEIIVGRRCINSEGQALQSPERITTAEPGQPCIHGVHCTEGSVCKGNICLCPDDTYLFHGECLGKSSQSKHFWRHAPLFSPQAMEMMRDDGENSLIEDPAPTRTVSAGAMCRISLECPYRTECIRGVCRCQKGETIVNAICRKSIYQVLPGGRCDAQRGLDCIGESHCFYGICVCLYGLVNIGNECASSEVLKKVAVGESCGLGQQCEGRSQCRDGLCQCPGGLRLDTNAKRCISSQQLNSYQRGTEDYDQDASGFGGQNGQHQELVGIHLGGGGENQSLPRVQIYSIPRQRLSSSAAIGSLLPSLEESRFNQILTANQMSINVLDQDTLKALLGTKMLSQLPQLGDRCDISHSQQQRFDDGDQTATKNACAGNAKCIRSVCQCTDGQLESDGKCVGHSKIQHRLNLNNDENKEDARANSQIKNFLQNYRSSSDFENGNNQQSKKLPQNQFSFSSSKTFPAGFPGELCTPQQKCYGGAVCINNLCVCRPGYHPQNGYCQIAKVALGGACFFSEQCAGHGYCIDGQCACKSDSFGHAKSVAKMMMYRHKCPPRPVALAGADCTKQQACAWNSICSTHSGVCECPHGMESLKGGCIVARQSRGVECLSSGHCQPKAYCDNGRCICKTANLLPGNMCLMLHDDHTRHFDERMMFHSPWQQGWNNAPRNRPSRVDRSTVDREEEFEYFDENRQTRKPHRAQEHAFGKKAAQHRWFPAFDNGESMWGRQAFEEPQNRRFFQNQMPPSKTEWFWTKPNAEMMQQQQQKSIGGDTEEDPYLLNASPNYMTNQFLTAAQSTNNVFGSNNKMPFGYNFVQNSNTFTPFQAYTATNSFQPSANAVPTLDLNKMDLFETNLSQQQNAADFPVQTVKHPATTVRLTMAMPGEHCNQHERICVGNSHCNAGWCQCGKGVRIEKSGICAYQSPSQTNTNDRKDLSHLKKEEDDVHRAPQKPHQQTQLRKPNESCGLNPQGCVEGAICVKSQTSEIVRRFGPYCKCSPTRVNHDGVCVLKQKQEDEDQETVRVPIAVGKRCLEDDICESGAQCGVDGICVCRNGSEFQANLCIHISQPGESCADGEFCAEGAQCISGINTCVCPVGTLVRSGKCEKEGSITFPQKTLPTPDWLSKEVSHKLTNRWAIDNKPSQHPHTQSAWPPSFLHEFSTTTMAAHPTAATPFEIKAALGQACVLNEDCASGECSPAKVCACPIGTEMVYGQCVSSKLIRHPGEHCVVSEHFCVGQSWCKEGICECFDRKVVDANGKCVDRRRMRLLKFAEFYHLKHKARKPPQFEGSSEVEEHQKQALQNALEQQNFLREFTFHPFAEGQFSPSSTTENFVFHLPAGHQQLPPFDERHFGATQQRRRAPQQQQLSFNSAARKLGHAPPLKKFVPILCGVNLDCPTGAKCATSKCQCNKLTIVIEQDFAASSPMSNWRHGGKCKKDADCPAPLNCVNERCVCVARVNEQHPHSSLSERHFKTTKPTKNLAGRRTMHKFGKQLASTTSISSTPPLPEAQNLVKKKTASSSSFVAQRVRHQNYQPPRKRVAGVGVKRMEMNEAEDSLRNDDYRFADSSGVDSQQKKINTSESHLRKNLTEELIEHPIFLITSQETSLPEVSAKRQPHHRAQTSPTVAEEAEKLEQNVILPSKFCNAFSNCGTGAECLAGRCQCIRREQRLTFANGTTLCVDHDVYSKKNEEVAKMEDKSPKNANDVGFARKLQSFQIVPSRFGSGRSEGGTSKAAAGEFFRRRLMVDSNTNADHKKIVSRREAITTTTQQKKILEKVQKILKKTFKDNERDAFPGASCVNNETCTGGSSCIAGLCACAPGFAPTNIGICMAKPSLPQQGNNASSPLSLQLHSYQQNGGLTAENAKSNVPTNINLISAMITTTTATPATTTTTTASARRLCAPSTECGPLDLCTGGSTCVEGWCLCPAGTRPSSKTRNCETFVQRMAAEAVAFNNNKAKITPKLTTPPASPITNVLNRLLLRAKKEENKSITSTPTDRTHILNMNFTSAGRGGGGSSNETTRNKRVERSQAEFQIASMNEITPLDTDKPIEATGEELKETVYDECRKLGIICAAGTTCLEAKCLDICCLQQRSTRGEGKADASYAKNCVVVKPEKSFEKEISQNLRLLTNPQQNAKSFARKSLDKFSKSFAAFKFPFKPQNQFRAKRSDDDDQIDVLDVLGHRYSRPSESCAGGEICTGGSICEGSAKICVCPPLKPIVREHICIPSNQKPMINPKLADPDESCDDLETKCTHNSICHEGVCKCQAGSIKQDGKCVEIDKSTTPWPANLHQRPKNSVDQVSAAAAFFAPNSATTGFGAPAIYSNTINNSNNFPSTSSPSSSALHTFVVNDATSFEPAATDSDGEGGGGSGSQMHRFGKSSKQQPLVVGPPLRKHSSSSSAPTAETDKGPLKTGDGPGVCPPGNAPLMEEESGRLVVCNGMSPNCPPRSYCFVTGAASETYNCCKVY